MMRTALVAALGVAAAAQAPPHLSQAWQANSIGDGSPDFGTGLAKAGGIAVFGGGNAGCMGAFFEAVANGKLPTVR